MFSRITTRSQRSGVRPAIGVGTPGIELDRPQVDVEVEVESQLQQEASLEDSGGTSGVPTAPSRMASCRLSSLLHRSRAALPRWSGSAVLRGRSPRLRFRTRIGGPGSPKRLEGLVR